MRLISRSALAAALGLAAVLAGSAHAASIPVDLQVEGSEGRSYASERYMTDTTSVVTEKGHGCKGSGDRKTISGPTALGVLVDAARVKPLLAPVAVTDQFDFGLLTCGVATEYASGANSFWLYKVNHVEPTVGADANVVEPGDDVLWYLVDTVRDTNSGHELQLRAPARAEAGEQFEVRVVAYDKAGVSTPAAGVLVEGGGVPVRTDAGGVARITFAGNARLTLRASLDPHVPAAPVSVCVNEDLARCPRAHGKTIYGSRRSERIRGTAGPDRVRAAGGRDRINVRKGFRDRVRCGRGRDTVLAGARDRVARDCEVVRRRGQL
jgi:hypothetical protein